MAGKVGLLKSVGDTRPGYVWLFGENQIKVDHMYMCIYRTVQCLVGEVR